MRAHSLAFLIMLSACASDPADPNAPDGGDPGDPDATPAPATGIERCAAGGTLAELWAADNQHGTVVSMSTDPAGVVVLGSEDHSVKQWNIRHEVAQPADPPTYGTPFDLGDGVTYALGFSADSYWLVGGDDTGAASVWYVEDGTLAHRRDFGDTPLAVVALHPDSARLFVADRSFGGGMRVWSLAGDTTSAVLPTELWNTTDATWADADTLLVSGHVYGQPFVERRAAAAPEAIVEGWGPPLGDFSSQHTRIARAPGGLVVAVSTDMFAVLRIDDLAAGPLAIAHAGGDDLIAVAATPGGRAAVTLAASGRIQVWDLAAAAPGATLDAPVSAGVGLDADGARILSGGADAVLRAYACTP